MTSFGKGKDQYGMCLDQSKTSIWHVSFPFSYFKETMYILGDHSLIICCMQMEDSTSFTRLMQHTGGNIMSIIYLMFMVGFDPMIFYSQCFCIIKYHFTQRFTLMSGGPATVLYCNHLLIVFSI